MEDNVLAAKVILTGIIAAGSAVWGWFGWLVILWVICMGLDYLTGSLAAMKKGEWSSDKAREGLWHKGGMVLIVLVAVLTDLAISLILRSGVVKFPFDYSILLTVLVISWYTLTELGSILENAVTLAPDKVPGWLRKLLRVAAETIDETGGKIAGGDDDAEQP